MKYTDTNKVCLFKVLTPWFCSKWYGNHVEFFSFKFINIYRWQKRTTMLWTLTIVHFAWIQHKIKHICANCILCATSMSITSTYLLFLVSVIKYSMEMCCHVSVCKPLHVFYFISCLICKSVSKWIQRYFCVSVHLISEQLIWIVLYIGWFETTWYFDIQSKPGDSGHWSTTESLL